MIQIRFSLGLDSSTSTHHKCDDCDPSISRTNDTSSGAAEGPSVLYFFFFFFFFFVSVFFLYIYYFPTYNTFYPPAPHLVIFTSRNVVFHNSCSQNG